MKKPARPATLLVLLLTSALWAGCDSNGGGGTPPPSSNLSGTVRATSTGTPLPNATVMLGSAQTTTDQDGRFAFRDVPVTATTISVSAARFDPYTRQITLQVGDNTHDVSMVSQTYYGYESNEGNFGIYLPPWVSTIRGVVFYSAPNTVDARGFANGRPVTGPDPPGPAALLRLNTQVAGLRQRALQMAERHGLALMGAELTAIDQQAGALAALEQIAAGSGHPELAQAPLLVVGMSSGGCYAYRFARVHSARVIGFVTQKGNCHTTGDTGPARLVPGYLFLGAGDSPPPDAHTITQVFEANRAAGALWALAIEANTGHTPVVDLDLLARWMDTVLEARLPGAVTPGMPPTLNALDETSGWLGNRESFAIAEYALYNGDRQQASWLPSMTTAQDWQAFVSAGN